MSEELPAPLVPADVDLRDYGFMPLFGERLFRSDTWILADDAERVAALRGWWASWHQEPAGSLPDDDRLLADLCGYGVAVSAWRKVRVAALRGWIKCSDGRLYHPVVCEIAADVWRKKRKKDADNATDRERKRRKRLPCPPDTPPLSAGQSEGIPPENPLKGSGSGSGELPLPSVGVERASNRGNGHERRKSRIQADWRPDEQDRQYAASKGYDERWIDEQAERFRDHHLRAGSAFIDWHAAWRTWVQRAPDFARGAQGQRSSDDRPGAGGVVAALRGL